MTAPVNLSNLREMTDGDKELEEALFQEFFSSTEALLDQLNEALNSNDPEAWRAAAHALKGTSYNLGAQKLGDYCKTAQEGHTGPHEEKAALLMSLRKEYQGVKEFLENELN